MSISEISIKKPVFAWMLMSALIIFGAISFGRMGVSNLPDIDFPVVSISATLDGASPEEIETDVVDVIESYLMGIEGVMAINSTANTGKASISVEFKLSKNIDVAVQEVQNVLSKANKMFPKEMDPPSVSKTNPEDQPIMWVSVSSPKLSKRELMSLVQDRLKDQFTTIEGVGTVSLGGYTDPNLRIWVSAKKLADRELTISDVLDTLNTEHTESPGGRLEQKEKEFNVRTMGALKSVEAFKEITINKRGGSPNYIPVKLKDVVVVEDGLAEVRSKSRVKGVPSVGMAIVKQRGANAVAVSHAIKEKLAHLQKELPESVSMGIRFDSTQFIEDSVHELNFTLLFSAILTALVCWIFLGSFTATLNVILAIPTSVVGTFICLYAFGFTLNTFTILGLSLAIGIVVDDAIMVLENIVRHREKGEKRRLAALNGTHEISFAAMAATASIMAIFLPVAFMEGIIGKFFFQFGITISVAVLLSLLEALTLTPMRCAEFLSIGPRQSAIGRLMEWMFQSLASLYARLIPYCIEYRLTTIFVALLIFSSSLLLTKQLRKEFIPAQDQGILMVRLKTAVGSSLDFTDRKVFQIEKVLDQFPEISSYFTSVGGHGGSVNGAFIFITLSDPKTRPRHTEIIPRLRAALSQVKGVKAIVQDPSTIGFASKRGFPVEFSIKGADFEKLVSSSKKMMQEIEAKGWVDDIDTNYQEGMPEIQIIPKRESLKQHGVSVAEITKTINAMVGGIANGKFSKDGHRYDIRVRSLYEDRTSPQDIKRFLVRNNRGEMIRLEKLVDIKISLGPQSIFRENRERSITITGNIPKGLSQDVIIQEIQKIGDSVLEKEQHLSFSGSSQTFKDSFKALIFALLLGVVVAYMILASQFNSFIHPLTVLMALPFGLSGALAALYLTGQSVNIYSMIGIILLMGIIKKNSILLVDFTNQLREQHLSVHEALLKAGPIRLRPIIMTSVATLVGAIPPALALGPGAEARIPMAVSVLGGVALSTFLTLFVVPAVYSLLSHLERKRSLE